MRKRLCYLSILLFLFWAHPLYSQWVQTNGPYGGNVFSLVAFGENLIAGTSGGGVFLSANNGASWSAASTGLTNTYVQSLAVLGTNLFAGTEGSGVWRRPLSELVTSVDGSVAQLPKSIALEQNYPNPFNPSTRIRYELPKGATVSVRITNSLGQLVATLVDGHREAGYHQVEWNAATLPSGIYFCRLQARPADGGQAGEFEETKRMILLK